MALTQQRLDPPTELIRSARAAPPPDGLTSTEKANLAAALDEVWVHAAAAFAFAEDEASDDPVQAADGLHRARQHLAAVLWRVPTHDRRDLQHL